MPSALLGRRCEGVGAASTISKTCWTRVVMCLGAVFGELFTNLGQAKRKAAKAPSSKQDDEVREHRRAWMLMSGAVMPSPLSRAAVRISSVAKAPIFHWFCWAEKATASIICSPKGRGERSRG